MNAGLILRAFRESWPMTLMLGLAVMLAEAALAFVLPKFGAQLSAAWLRLEFVRGLLQAMLGAEVGHHIGIHMFQAFAWLHPVVLALTWAHAMTLCTRLPAGEVDVGTIDVLLGLPVSRWEMYLSETLVWVTSAAGLMGAALLGHLFGSLGLPAAQRPPWPATSIVVLNLFCLYAAVGGFTCLVSASSNRRGRAVTTVFVVMLALFLLHYLAQFWAPLSKFAFLSPLHYHRPVVVLAEGPWPWRDCAVLLSFGLVTWLAGGWVFARRDLCTV